MPIISLSIIDWLKIILKNIYIKFIDLDYKWIYRIFNFIYFKINDSIYYLIYYIIFNIIFLLLVFLPNIFILLVILILLLNNNNNIKLLP